MSFILLATIALLSLAFVISKRFLSRGYGVTNLPGGSLGFPVIGETLGFLKAQRKDRGPEWLNERVRKYGPVFKTSLMGSPTVVIVGQAGNKFVLGGSEDVFVAKQPTTLQAIAGKQNIFELTGVSYKQVKGAMVSFLKPESLQNYIPHMNDLAKDIFLKETKGKVTIKAVVTMKKLTFHIACIILFGISDVNIRDILFDEFSLAFKAVWSLPVKLPGTVFWKGLKARSRIVNLLLPIIRERRDELSKGTREATSDVLTSLLALKDENEEPISDDMVMDNVVTLMIASHDTSAILLSLMIWKLSRDAEIYKKVLEEQMEVKEKRQERNKLRWSDIQKMKYTWRVAQEMMRIIPPVFGSFRKALKDVNYGGYDIPKGWQVFWTSHGTHMNEEIFENPAEFNPMRFDNPSKPIPPYAYIPFGGGLHSCIGNEFARVETLIAIHNLVTMYEWSVVNPHEEITRRPMPYPSMGLPIKLKPRHPF